MLACLLFDFGLIPVLSMQQTMTATNRFLCHVPLTTPMVVMLCWQQLWSDTNSNSKPYEHIFIWNQNIPQEGGMKGRIWMWQQNQRANFYIVLHSNYASILLSFWDMTQQTFYRLHRSCDSFCGLGWQSCPRGAGFTYMPDARPVADSVRAVRKCLTWKYTSTHNLLSHMWWPNASIRHVNQAD